MRSDRRVFVKQVCGLTAAGLGLRAATPASASTHGHEVGDVNGVLVDLTLCVGCRLCEYACKEANGIETGPLESYDDKSVFAEQRRPAPDAFTVVNEHKPRSYPLPVYAKVNCLHCNHPACVSACIVGALRKQPDGAVTYDAWKCIGCRYCMVACPFQIPAYEYNDVLTPEVRKCELCFERVEDGGRPACVESCPRGALICGKRGELLALAHERIAKEPDKYVDHVYGEHEVGGTSWLYISPAPFEELDFVKVGTDAPPALTEAIQHGVFKMGIAPVGWYAFLSGAMWWTGRRAKAKREASAGAQASSVSAIPASLPVAHEKVEAPCAPTNNHGQNHVQANGHGHASAEPMGGSLLTPGVLALLALVGVGVLSLLYRFVFGLQAATNLDQQHPWGLWIAMDVGSGIALAGGGFVTAALVHIFHRERYHAVARSALLMALLGYTFYVPGLLADIGRWYNIWHPTLPNMWQGNSVLFEVGICVMLYLNVQYAELAPIICERLETLDNNGRWRWLALAAGFVSRSLQRVMPALLVLGVALSTFHQSSLGNLMVIAPGKLHALWWTPVSPVLFLLSAVMVGLPVVIFTILCARWSLKQKPELEVLSPLSRYVVPALAAYLALKVGDLAARGVWPMLVDGSLESKLWLTEVLGGVVLPLVLLAVPKLRRSPRWLGWACLLVILGVVLNRLNVFVLAYTPPYAERVYVPSFVEFGLSIGLVAALLLVYRVAVTYLPIIEPRPLRDEVAETVGEVAPEGQTAQEAMT